MNNEPKSAQVCVGEAQKRWAEASKEMTDVQRAETEKLTNQISRKIEMERKNKDQIGDINEYTFQSFNYILM